MLGLAAACTANNPAYEATGEDAPAGDETTAAVVAITSTSSSSGPPPEPEDETTGSSSGTTGMAPVDGDTSSSDAGDPPIAELCLADLYGINVNGEIHLIDVDAGTTVPLPPDPALDSYALATDPATGSIYVNPRLQPTVVLVLEPVTFEVESELMITGNGLVEMARAGFDPAGNLWLGTYDTNDFFRISTADGTSEQHTVLGIGAGGDLVFLDDERALVSSLLGELVVVDLPLGTFSPVPIEGMPGGLLLTGLARDHAGRLWLASENGMLHQIGFDEREPLGAYLDHVIELDTTINDLATVVAEPPGC